MLDNKHILPPVRDGTDTKGGGAKEDDQLLPVGGSNPCMSGSSILHSKTNMEALQQEIRYVEIQIQSP